MFTRQKLLRNVLAVGTVSAIVLFQSISTSNAQDVDDQSPLDHFKCYSAKSLAQGSTVDLMDEFGLEENVFGTRKPWLKPNMLCNPVMKLHDGKEFPIRHPKEHLVCYKLKGRGMANKKIMISNQFGEEQRYVVYRQRALCVPSSKFLVQSDGQIDEELQSDCSLDPLKCPLDHFKCYTLRNFADNLTPSPRINVSLTDQFGEEEIKAVVRPRMLCNPATKWHDDKEFPVLHPDEHLMCYMLKKTKIADKTVIVANQFGEKQRLYVGASNYLCLPSKMFVVEDEDEGGT